MGEFELIAELFAPLATDPGALGLLDDASVISVPPSHEAVVTKDVLVESVHFLEGTDPARVAQKLLRVNLSDLAAMGATPMGYWLGVQLPKGPGREWLESFVRGLQADQEEFGLSLMGGDTVAAPGPIALSLTAMGSVPEGTALRRSGARAGDRIFVSGTIGDGALGLCAARGELENLAQADMAYLRDRLECPAPRLALGQALRGIASAAIDVSDGIAADAAHIADASGTGLEIDADRVPLSAAGRRALDGGLATLEDLMAGGDDYELLFTVPPERAERMADLSAGVPVTEIGKVVRGGGVRLFTGGAEMKLTRRGYTHF